MSLDLKKYPKPQRIRHHIAPNNYFKFNENNPSVEFYPPLYEEINWDDFYKNGLKPTHLDIGCGMGNFLLQSADNNRSENYLGIEVRKAPVEWIRSVIDGEKLSNCGVINYSVVNGLPFIEDGSIEKIYYFFPDPWFKKKHKKRRAFNIEFLEECYRVLSIGGILYLQTDIEEVHIYHKDILKEFGKFEFKEMAQTDNWELEETDQEKICKRGGFEYWKLVCRKG